MADSLPHVMHVASGSDAGGVSRYLLELSAALIDRGARVTIAGQRGPWHDRFEAKAVEPLWRWIEAPTQGGPLALWRAARQIINQLGSQWPDLLHVHYRKSALVGRLVQRVIVRRGGPRIPMLYTLHLTGIPTMPPWGWLSDYGDHTHAPSAQAKRWLLEVAGVPEQRITVIPHGVDTQRFTQPSPSQRELARAELGVPSSRLLAAYVGRLENPKNALWVVDMTAAGLARGLDLGVVMAGDGPDRPAIAKAIAARNLTGRIRLTGERDPIGVYHAADLVVLPSAREGFSYSSAEAMSCGVPVLRTRTAGTEEMIIEGVTGRSCAIDHDAFINAAIEMLQDRARLATMGQAAAEHIRSNLTFDRQLEQTMGLYRRLILS